NVSVWPTSASTRAGVTSMRAGRGAGGAFASCAAAIDEMVSAHKNVSMVRMIGGHFTRQLASSRLLSCAGDAAFRRLHVAFRPLPRHTCVRFSGLRAIQERFGFRQFRCGATGLGRFAALVLVFLTLRGFLFA